jgi:hypothetical protein
VGFIDGPPRGVVERGSTYEAAFCAHLAAS